MKDLQLKVYKNGDKINLYDGHYFIDMGPGWIYGNDKKNIVGSVVAPPQTDVEFNKTIKYENSKKIMASSTVGFNYKILEASISQALGNEWVEEVTTEQSIQYTGNDAVTYARFYATADRHEFITVEDGKIKDMGVVYIGGGMWGKMIKFCPDKVLDQNLLDEPFDKSFITDGQDSNVKLFKKILDNSSVGHVSYSNRDNYYNFYANIDKPGDFFAKINSQYTGTYKFEFSNNIYDKIIVYKEDGDFLDYITSIDNIDGNLEHSYIALKLEKNKNYYFRFIFSRPGKVFLTGRKLTNLDIGIINPHLDITNRSFIEVDLESGIDVVINRDNEFLEKEIFYGISIPIEPNIKGRTMQIKANNAFYEVKVYRDNNLSTHALKNKSKKISIKSGEYFVIGVTCKNIMDFNANLTLSIQ